jgi:hypothetical protein
MKILLFITPVIILITGQSFYSSRSFGDDQKVQTGLTGAWIAKKGSVDHVLIFQDGYFSCTIFDKVNRKFVRTWGGKFSESGGQIHANIEFDTESKNNIGGHRHYAGIVNAKSLTVDFGTGVNSWTKTDDGNANLAGNWRITGRMNDGQIQQMQRGARKTLKILSSTRFQWMAINPETKEFFGTGGGTYTFKDGKYTEQIEFFSKDSSRVGASLSFDGSIANNVWTHKGLSSKGEPIHEEWTREK